MSRVSHVYFIQIQGVGPIKIGCTGGETAQDRLAALQTSCPFDLSLLATVPAPGNGRASESFFHDRFAQYRMKGEWFAPGPELVGFLRTLGARPFVPVDWQMLRDNSKAPEPGIVRVLLGVESGNYSVYVNYLWICLRTLKNVVLNGACKEGVRDAFKAAKIPAVRIMSGLIRSDRAEVVVAPGISAHPLTIIQALKECSGRHLQVHHGMSMKSVWSPGYVCVGVGMAEQLQQFSCALVKDLPALDTCPIVISDG